MKKPTILKRSNHKILSLVEKATDEKYDYVSYLDETGIQKDLTLAIEMFYTLKISELEQRIIELENKLT